MILRVLFALLFAGCASGCGGGLSDKAANSLQNGARDSMMAIRLCRDDDAGGCKPSQVRALERAAFCANASVLASYGKDYPDAGDIRCQP